LFVSFSLESDAPARLDLLDIAGRRVLGHDVGALGAGTHILRLDAGAPRPPAGLYVLRLTQAGRVASTKVVVAR
jgi:hypothetical protein